MIFNLFVPGFLFKTIIVAIIIIIIIVSLFL